MSIYNRLIISFAIAVYVVFSLISGDPGLIAITKFYLWANSISCVLILFLPNIDKSEFLIMHTYRRIIFLKSMIVLLALIYFGHTFLAVFNLIGISCYFYFIAPEKEGVDA